MRDSVSGAAPTLFTRTGLAYFPLALGARLPFAMMVVGVLTILVSARGSVQLGGLGSAMVGIGAATVGPLVGAAADRFGQRAALLVAVVVHSAALLVLTLVAYSGVHVGWVFLVTFIVGASSPQVSPMSRSRLVTIIRTWLPLKRQTRVMSTTLAYESAADEIVFVFGPVVVGVLATAWGAWSPILGAAILTLTLVTAFALHRTAEPAKSAAERAATLAPARDLLRPRVLVIVVGIGAAGMVFGTTLTSLTAFAQSRGAAEMAGLLYGIMGTGSAVLALVVSLFSPRFTLRARWLVFALCTVVGGILYATAGDPSSGIPRILLALGVLGLGMGPLLVSLFTLGTIRSPEGRSTTVMTMLGSSLTLGQSLAAAATGVVAEQGSLGLALAFPLAAAVLGGCCAIVNWWLTPPGGREAEAWAGASPAPQMSAEE